MSSTPAGTCNVDASAALEPQSVLVHPPYLVCFQSCAQAYLEPNRIAHNKVS